jgi:hypothetical protein
MQEIVSHTKHISFLSHLSVTHNFSPHNLVFFTLFVTKKKHFGSGKRNCSAQFEDLQKLKIFISVPFLFLGKISY